MSTNVQKEHPGTQYHRILPWIIWTCPALFYLFQFSIRVSPNVLADNIMADLGVHAYVLGGLASWYYIGYTSMQIPVGLLVDRVGVRIPLFAAALLIGVGCYLFALTDQLSIMSVGRLFMGIGSAFAFISCVKTASIWFKPQRLGLIVGLTLMVGTMGATFGSAPLEMLVNYIGWRFSIQILGVVGIALAIYALAVVRDHPATAVLNERLNKGSTSWAQAIVGSALEILTNKHTYIFGLYGGMMYVPLSGFADLWGPNFISHVYGEDKTFSALTVTMIYIGIAVGAPSSALLADYFKSYKKVLFMGAFGAFLAFTLHLYAYKLPFNYLYVNYFIIGFFLGSQFLGFAAVCANNRLENAAAATGIHNMMCMASGIVFQPFIGYLLDLTWDKTMKGGAPFYSQVSYDIALMVIPVSLLIASGACYYMKETYKRT